MRAFVLLCTNEISTWHQVRGWQVKSASPPKSNIRPSDGRTEDRWTLIWELWEFLSYPVICVGNIHGSYSQVVDEGSVITSCSRQVPHPVRGRERKQEAWGGNPKPGLISIEENHHTKHFIHVLKVQISSASLIIQQNRTDQLCDYLIRHFTYGWKRRRATCSTLKSKSTFIVMIKPSIHSLNGN